MSEESISENVIGGFSKDLMEKERAKSTTDKYMREVRLLQKYLDEREITKSVLLSYREELRIKYKAQTVNGKISAVNAFLDYAGFSDLKLRLLRVQHRPFVEDNRELSQEEYKRLLETAKELNRERLYHVMITICGTGIRISELKYITVEAVEKGRAEISMKGKERLIMIPKELRKKLMEYAKGKGIRSGSVFLTKKGNLVDRSNICHEMKKICRIAHVDESKAFPHNLRHLFARRFYAVEKNLSYLADILGHSSIETTRIYVATSAKQCEKTMEKMKLVF